MMDFNVTEIIGKIGLFYVPFLFALCFHEFAHGWVAKKKGDNTAEMMGRLTMNPFAHIDPIGTVALPLMAIITGIPFFGWAKPVPVNPRNLRSPENDMFWIAFAGPLSNVLLAFIGCVLFVLSFIFLQGHGLMNTAVEMLKMFIIVNLFLAIFNMIPLHPLDGGKVVGRFLPRDANNWLEENQHVTSMILLMLFVLGGFRYLATPVYWIYNNMMAIVLAAAELIV
jgi:Zn-dependent protease